MDLKRFLHSYQYIPYASTSRAQTSTTTTATQNVRAIMSAPTLPVSSTAEVGVQTSPSAPVVAPSISDPSPTAYGFPPRQDSSTNTPSAPSTQNRCTNTPMIAYQRPRTPPYQRPRSPPFSFIPPQIRSNRYSPTAIRGHPSRLLFPRGRGRYSPPHPLNRAALFTRSTLSATSPAFQPAAYTLASMSRSQPSFQRGYSPLGQAHQPAHARSTETVPSFGSRAEAFAAAGGRFQPSQTPPPAPLRFSLATANMPQPGPITPPGFTPVSRPLTPPDQVCIEPNRPPPGTSFFSSTPNFFTSPRPRTPPAADEIELEVTPEVTIAVTTPVATPELYVPPHFRTGPGPIRPPSRCIYREHQYRAPMRVRSPEMEKQSQPADEVIRQPESLVQAVSRVLEQTVQTAPIQVTVATPFEPAVQRPIPTPAVQPAQMPVQPVEQAVQPPVQKPTPTPFVQAVQQPIQPIEQAVQPPVQRPIPTPSVQTVQKPVQPIKQTVQPPIERLAPTPFVQPVQKPAKPVKHLVLPPVQKVRPQTPIKQTVQKPVKPVQQSVLPPVQKVPQQKPIQPAVQKPVKPIQPPVQKVSQQTPIQPDVQKPVKPILPPVEKAPQATKDQPTDQKPVQQSVKPPVQKAPQPTHGQLAVQKPAKPIQRSVQTPKPTIKNNQPETLARTITKLLEQSVQTKSASLEPPHPPAQTSSHEATATTEPPSRPPVQPQHGFLEPPVQPVHTEPDPIAETLIKLLIEQSQAAQAPARPVEQPAQVPTLYFDEPTSAQPALPPNQIARQLIKLLEEAQAPAQAAAPAPLPVAGPSSAPAVQSTSRQMRPAAGRPVEPFYIVSTRGQEREDHSMVPMDVVLRYLQTTSNLPALEVPEQFDESTPRTRSADFGPFPTYPRAMAREFGERRVQGRARRYVRPVKPRTHRHEGKNSFPRHLRPHVEEFIQRRPGPMRRQRPRFVPSCARCEDEVKFAETEYQNRLPVPTPVGVRVSFRLTFEIRSLNPPITLVPSPMQVTFRPFGKFIATPSQFVFPSHLANNPRVKTRFPMLYIMATNRLYVMPARKAKLPILQPLQRLQRPQAQQPLQLLPPLPPIKVTQAVKSPQPLQPLELLPLKVLQPSEVPQPPQVLQHAEVVEPSPVKQPPKILQPLQVVELPQVLQRSQFLQPSQQVLKPPQVEQPSQVLQRSHVLQPSPQVLQSAQPVQPLQVLQPPEVLKRSQVLQPSLQVLQPSQGVQPTEVVQPSQIIQLPKVLQPSQPLQAVQLVQVAQPLLPPLLPPVVVPVLPATPPPAPPLPIILERTAWPVLPPVKPQSQPHLPPIQPRVPRVPRLAEPSPFPIRRQTYHATRLTPEISLESRQQQKFASDFALRLRIATPPPPSARRPAKDECYETGSDLPDSPVQSPRRSRDSRKKKHKKKKPKRFLKQQARVKLQKEQKALMKAEEKAASSDSMQSQPELKDPSSISSDSAPSRAKSASVILSDVGQASTISTDLDERAYSQISSDSNPEPAQFSAEFQPPTVYYGDEEVVQLAPEPPGQEYSAPPPKPFNYEDYEFRANSSDDKEGAVGIDEEQIAMILNEPPPKRKSDSSSPPPPAYDFLGSPRSPTRSPPAPAAFPAPARPEIRAEGGAVRRQQQPPKPKKQKKAKKQEQPAVVAEAILLPEPEPSAFEEFVHLLETGSTLDERDALPELRAQDLDDILGVMDEPEVLPRARLNLSSTSSDSPRKPAKSKKQRQLWKQERKQEKLAKKEQEAAKKAQENEQKSYELMPPPKTDKVPKKSPRKPNEPEAKPKKGQKKGKKEQEELGEEEEVFYDVPTCLVHPDRRYEFDDHYSDFEENRQPPEEGTCQCHAQQPAQALGRGAKRRRRLRSRKEAARREREEEERRAVEQARLAEEARIEQARRQKELRQRAKLASFAARQRSRGVRREGSPEPEPAPNPGDQYCQMLRNVTSSISKEIRAKGPPPASKSGDARLQDLQEAVGAPSVAAALTTFVEQRNSAPGFMEAFSAVAGMAGAQGVDINVGQLGEMAGLDQDARAFDLVQTDRGFEVREVRSRMMRFGVGQVVHSEEMGVGPQLRDTPTATITEVTEELTAKQLRMRRKKERRRARKKQEKGHDGDESELEE